MLHRCLARCQHGHLWVVRACVRSCFSCVQLLAAVAHQAPLSLGLSRQEYWSVLSCPPPGDLPRPGIKPTSYVSCIALPQVPPGKPLWAVPNPKCQEISCPETWHGIASWTAGQECSGFGSHAAACRWVIVGHVEVPLQPERQEQGFSPCPLIPQHSVEHGGEGHPSKPEWTMTAIATGICLLLLLLSRWRLRPNNEVTFLRFHDWGSQWFLHWGDLFLPEDIWQHLETLVNQLINFKID